MGQNTDRVCILATAGQAMVRTTRPRTVVVRPPVCVAVRTPVCVVVRTLGQRRDSCTVAVRTPVCVVVRTLGQRRDIREQKATKNTIVIAAAYNEKGTIVCTT